MNDRTWRCGWLSAALAFVLPRPAAAEPAAPPPPFPVEAELAIRRFRVAPGLKVELVAAEPQLVNPVAFCIDERGRFYVAETQRFAVSSIDIRKHMNWLDADLSWNTVADRVDFLKRTLRSGLDGLDTVSERIRRIEDRDGDGRADHATTFAEDFKDIAAACASGVLARGNDVWAAVAPDLWLLRDTDGDGRADERRRLLTGFGVHMGFSAHDLHGLCWGPDGKLYFSMGDHGLRVETENGVIDNPDSGGVLRCNPDGTGLELYAFGMRNPQELAFDQHGNLWTGENTADFGDRVRWVYVVEGGDCGWRLPYQFQPAGGLWLSERLWEGVAAYQIPPVGHVGHGPSGIAFYPGTGLPERYNDHFLLCDFPGGVQSFAVKPKGASFELVGRETFLGDLWPTDVEFGPDGGAYVSDWVFGWRPPQKGRIYRVFDPALENDPAVAETGRLIREGMGGRPEEELARLLGHRDRRVRQAAQFELAGRASVWEGASAPEAGRDRKVAPTPDALASLAKVAAGRHPGRCARPDLARLHGIWGIGQVGEKDAEALEALLPLLSDPDAEVRTQATRVLGDRRAYGAYDDFVALLKDENPRVRFYAAIGLGRLVTAEGRAARPARTSAVGPLLEMIRENTDRDAYLRHAGVMGLAGIGDVERIVKAAKDPSASVRMAALLALRRLERPEVELFLGDADPAIVLEAARAIHDVPVEAAGEALAERLGRPVQQSADALAAGPAPKGAQSALLPGRPGLPEGVLFRAINANHRLGTAEAAARLVAYAAAPDAPVSGRAEAIRALAEWRRTSGRDRVTGFWRPLGRRDPGAAEEALRPRVENLLRAAPDAVRTEAARAAGTLGLVGAAPALDALLRDVHVSPEARRAALAALAALGDERLAAAVETALGDPEKEVLREGVRLLAQTKGAAAAARLLGVALGDGPAPARQAAVEALGGLEGVDEHLAGLLDRLLDGRLPPSIHLDLLEIAERRPAPALQARLARIEAARPKDDPLGPWRETLAGGDPVKGREVYFGRGGGECLRCHLMKLRGGDVGPPLTAIGGERTKEHLLASILFPNQEIAPGYEQAVVVTKDEVTEVGRVGSEDAEMLVLVTPEGKKRHIPKAEIQSRGRGLSAMPDGLGKKLSRRDLRDLVAYLATGPDNPQSVPAGEGTIVVDDDEPYRCLPVGSWRETSTGRDHGWTCQRAAPDPAGASQLIWEWTLPKPGRYRVYVWAGGLDRGPRLATNAPFTVEHAEGKTTVRVDLTKDPGSWRPLGTFLYNTTDHARLVLSNDADGDLIGDAVMYVPE